MSATRPPRITGGERSVRARTDDLRSVAGLLDAAGDDARSLTGRLLLTGLDLPAAGLLAPMTAARVAQRTAALTAGPHGLGVTAIRLELIGVALRGSAQAYDEAERAAADRLHRLQDAIAAPALAVLAAGSLLTAVQRETFRPTCDSIPDAALHDLNANLYSWPWGTDLALHLIPGDVPTAVLAAGVLTAARALGVGLDDRPLLVRPASPPEHTGRLAPDRVSRAAPPTPDLAGLMDVQADLTQGKDHSTGSRIRVDRVRGDDGRCRWVVHLPGTQSWSLQTQPNPSDGPRNLELMAGASPRMQEAVTRAVEDAMRREGVVPGTEPVLLSGHSQGGMLAMRLARDETFRRRFAVRSVVTAGSPVGGMDVPPGVELLSVEHRTDPVPRLDGGDGRERPRRVRAVLDPTLPQGVVAPRSGQPALPEEDGPVGSHDSRRYALSARTALGRDTHDPVLARWYARNGAWLGTPAGSHDYLLVRDLPGATGTDGPRTDVHLTDGPGPWPTGVTRAGAGLSPAPASAGTPAPPAATGGGPRPPA